MAAARSRCIGTRGGQHAVRARHAVAGTQGGFQVGVHRAGNMRCKVALLARVRLHQLKTAVKHAQGLAACHQVLELFG